MCGGGLPAPDGDGIVLGVDGKDLLGQVGLHHLLDLRVVFLPRPVLFFVPALLLQVLQEPFPKQDNTKNKNKNKTKQNKTKHVEKRRKKGEKKRETRGETGKTGRQKRPTRQRTKKRRGEQEGRGRGRGVLSLCMAVVV